MQYTSAVYNERTSRGGSRLGKPKIEPRVCGEHCILNVVGTMCWVWREVENL